MATLTALAYRVGLVHFGEPHGALLVVAGLAEPAAVVAAAVAERDAVGMKGAGGAVDGGAAATAAGDDQKRWWCGTCPSYNLK
ncbi:hypothetical protein RvY_18735 [Ramazzottius varieornatus]|uniref:Uncharacterized protein n=1 Tax=Ramazzottius varieornatus TaxID=947166 RepID=A0A1D1W6X3_RAMVA|nr:hypothetical protein RvY_18735 [Ramazzottius varieornatus]